MENSSPSPSSSDDNARERFDPMTLFGDIDSEGTDCKENGGLEEVTGFSSSHWPWPWSNITRSCPNASVEYQSPRNDDDDNNDKAVAIVTGAGLANLGNTCFLNAVLQCFMHTIPLIDGVLLDENFEHCKEDFCVMCALRNLVGQTLDPNNRVVFPWKIFNNLSYFSSSFQIYEQEDAHEFLQCFLDRLERCHDFNHKRDMSLLNDNLVQKVFGGRLVSKLRCHNCLHCSNTYEPLIDLSLEIEDADNLMMALESFTKLEKIDDEETKFTCEGCKEQVPIEKQLALDQIPPIAMFHLKRFKNDGQFVHKIDKHVAFPLELDLQPFTASSQKHDAELRYVLYAVVVHIELTSTCGHYYCFVRVSPNIWCQFDDSEVVLVHEDFVLSQEAYVLFYAKEGTPWFSSYVETLKLGIWSNMRNTSPKSVLDNVYSSSSSPDLLKNIQCYSDTTLDVTESKYEAFNIKTSEIKYHGPNHNVIEDGETTDHQQRAFVQVSPLAGDSLTMLLPEALVDVSPRSCEVKVEPGQEAASAGNNLSPQRTPRFSSPEICRETPISPEIYREDPPDSSISHDKIKLIHHKSCKRRLERGMDDLKTKQARSYIKRRLPGSRGLQRLAALRSLKTEGSLNMNCKRSRFCLSRNHDSRRRRSHH